MKKLLSLFFVLTFIAQAFCYAFEVDGIYYNITSTDDKTVEVSYDGFSSYSGSVTIPGTVTNEGTSYSVTGIGCYAFSGCWNLTDITIPDGVTYIDSYAFRRCSNLYCINMPNSVTRIGECAFEECQGLGLVILPISLTSISNQAFQGCYNIQFLYISCKDESDLATYISGDCQSLIEQVPEWYKIHRGIIIDKQQYTSITIPNSVTSIGNYAFFGCSGLTSINIPNSVTSIGGNAFYGCSGLTSITIPNSVTSIGNYAFFGCSGLTSITIPVSITSIEDGTFSGCSSLTSINIPESVTSIGRYVFDGCTSLPIIDNIRYAGPYLVEAVNFDQSTLSIKEGTKVIGESAFYECSSITNLTIPESVTSIGENAFYGCCGLTSLTIPESVTSIGYGAFYGCKLRDIQILAETPPSIEEHTFSGQSRYHTTLLVPVGCWDKYAYDDSWYSFINIKENATATKELSKVQAYALKSVADRSYLVYDPVNDAIATVELDDNYNVSDPNQNWQFIEQDGETYIYNLGAKKYLAPVQSNQSTPMRGMAAAITSTSWTLSDTPVAISLKDDANGVNVGNSGAWMFVLNETLAVDQNASGIETIANETSDAPAYDLQGRRTSGNGIQIQHGKKMLIK